MAAIEPTDEGGVACNPFHNGTYMQMIIEALVDLNERNGSSQHAIAKHIVEVQKFDQSLSPNFKKILSNRLKKLVGEGKLIMVKKSYKLDPKIKADALLKKKLKKPKRMIRKKEAPPVVTSVLRPYLRRADSVSDSESGFDFDSESDSPMPSPLPLPLPLPMPAEIPSPEISDYYGSDDLEM